MTFCSKIERFLIRLFEVYQVSKSPLSKITVIKLRVGCIIEIRMKTKSNSRFKIENYGLANEHQLLEDFTRYLSLCCQWGEPWQV